MSVFKIVLFFVVLSTFGDCADRNLRCWLGNSTHLIQWTCYGSCAGRLFDGVAYSFCWNAFVPDGCREVFGVLRCFCNHPLCNRRRRPALDLGFHTYDTING